MSEPARRRRLSRTRLRRLLEQLDARAFTSGELAAVCRAAHVKYDTVQRAIVREGLVKIDGLVVPIGGELKGAPERRYVVIEAA